MDDKGAIQGKKHFQVASMVARTPGFGCRKMCSMWPTGGSSRMPDGPTSLSDVGTKRDAGPGLCSRSARDSARPHEMRGAQREG